MKFKKLVSVVSALAMIVTSMAGLCVTANAAAGDLVQGSEISINDIVDTNATNAIYYSDGTMIFPTYNGVDRTGYVYFSQPIDITGGSDENDVVITFNMAHEANTYTPGGNNNRWMTFQDSAGSAVLPTVNNYNWGGIYFNSTSDASLGNSSTGTGTACKITIFSSGNDRVAVMQVGDNQSATYPVTGNTINRIQLSIGSGISQAKRLLKINNLAVAQYEPSSKYRINFAENNGADISVYVNNALVSGNSQLFSPGEYSFMAIAPGYDTYFGEFTVADTGYNVNFTMNPVPTAPENTNSTAPTTKRDDIALNGAITTKTVNNPIALAFDEQGSIEFDVYVPVGSSANFTLGNKNATGPNINFVANSETTTVNYTISGENTDDIITYSSKQWVHVKADFVTAQRTGNGGTDADIRLSSYQVTITPTTGASATGAPTIRNLAADFGSGSSSYSFDQIKFNGTANIANAEMYVLADETSESQAEKVGFDASGADSNQDAVAYMVKDFTMNGTAPVWTITADFGEGDETAVVNANIPSVEGQASLGIVLYNLGGATVKGVTLGYPAE